MPSVGVGVVVPEVMSSLSVLGVPRSGADSGGVLGVHGPPLGLHRYIEQYVYYPAVIHLSGFTVRSIILFTNAAILHINPPSPPERD